MIKKMALDRREGNNLSFDCPLIEGLRFEVDNDK